MAWNKNHVLERVVLDMLASYQPLYVFTDDRQKLSNVRQVHNMPINAQVHTQYPLIRCPRLANNRLYV